MPLRRLTDKVRTLSPIHRLGLGTLLGALFLGTAIFYLKSPTTVSPSHSLSDGLKVISPLSRAPLAAYTSDGLLEALSRYGGQSKRVHAVIGLPGTTAGQGAGKVPVAANAPAGIWPLRLATSNAIHEIAGLRLITLMPFSAKQDNKIGLYYLGAWPSEQKRKGPPKAPSGKYAVPGGFIKVEQADLGIPVTDHFKLGDFLTHGIGEFGDSQYHRGPFSKPQRYASRPSSSHLKRPGKNSGS